MRMQASIIVSLFSVAVCACSSPTAIWDEEHISYVSSVAMPDTVTAGAEFTVTIRAYGGFERSRAGRNEITATPTEVEITPYDWETYWHGPVNRGIQSLVHEVPVTINHPGSCRVSVRHQVHIKVGDSVQHGLESISRDVVVLPAVN